MPLLDEPHRSPQQIADLYGFDEDTVYAWLRRGVVVSGRRVVLFGIKMGKSWRIPDRAWEAFVTACNGGTLPSLDLADDRRAAHEAALRQLKEVHGVG